MDRGLREQWRSHLCGLCLTLRDVAGQGSRVLTGYDVLLPSVLVEAQAGRSATTTAAPCPLRGFRTAEVLLSTSPAMQVAAATALLTGAAGLEDKVADGDIPAAARPLASRIGNRFSERGEAVSTATALDSRAVVTATRRALLKERDPDASLEEILEPAGSAVAAVFAHSATAADVPQNRALLAAAGDAFGRLVHLLDAVADRSADRRHHRYNPLEATGTDDRAARALADSLVGTIRGALAASHFVDRSLVDVLFGPTLTAAVTRAFPPAVPVARRSLPGATEWSGSPDRRRGTGSVVGVAVAAATARAAMWGGGRRRRRYRDDYDPYYGDPYVRPRRRFGSSCGQLLACECCANCCCNECCGGDNCCCCVV
jgi:hypothetical protein